MAKAIKFNLICDGNPIRTIEDLRQNFSIEDVLELYHNGLLVRWLEVRGYSDWLNQVNAISEKSDIDIISDLIKIFEVEIDDNKIEEGISVLQFVDEKKLLLEEYRKMEYEVTSIIDDYHSGYNALIDKIIRNNDNMAIIKACLNEIIESYYGLFCLDYRNLYYTLEWQAPMAIFAMLMIEEMRHVYLPNESDYDEKGLVSMPPDKRFIFDHISKIFSHGTFGGDSLIEILGENLLSFSGVTESYWKDIEPKGKRFMILRMEGTNFVRNSGQHGEELGIDQLRSKFAVLDGIDYKSNNPNHSLLYLEV